MVVIKDVTYMTVEDVLADLEEYGVTRNRLNGWRNQNRKGKDIGPKCVKILDKYLYPADSYTEWKEQEGI